MNTGIVYTVNDQSKPSSSLIVLFGDPNDYVSKLGNWSAYSKNSLIRHRSLTSSGFHNAFRAVAIDSQTSRIYYGNTAESIVAFSDFIVNNATNYKYFLAPPITKVVNLTFISLQCLNS